MKNNIVTSSDRMLREIQILVEDWGLNQEKTVDLLNYLVWFRYVEQKEADMLLRELEGNMSDE